MFRDWRLGTHSGATVFAIALSLGAISAAQAGDAAQDCRTGSPDARLNGCTRLLAEARTPRQRAIALDGRCWANIDRLAFADALSDCSQAIRADESYPYAFHNRGIAYAGLQNHNAALVDFNRALSMRPNFSNTLLNRAKSYVSLGDRNAAIRDYEEVLRLKPENEEAKSNLLLLRGSPSDFSGTRASIPAENSLCGSVGCN